VQPPRSPDLKPLHFYLRGQFKALVYSASIENEMTLNQGMFYASQIIRNRPGTFASVHDQMCA
jgi:hypothetical protein